MTPIMEVGDEPPPLSPSGAASKPSKPKGKAGGRFAVFNAFADFSMGDLSRADIIVWVILYRDCKDGVARTAQADIARRGKIDRRTVGRSLRRLEARGLLRIAHRGGFRRGVSRYLVRGLATESG